MLLLLTLCVYCHYHTGNCDSSLGLPHAMCSISQKTNTGHTPHTHTHTQTRWCNGATDCVYMRAYTSVVRRRPERRTRGLPPVVSLSHTRASVVSCLHQLALRRESVRKMATAGPRYNRARASEYRVLIYRQPKRAVSLAPSRFYIASYCCCCVHSYTGTVIFVHARECTEPSPGRNSCKYGKE